MSPKLRATIYRNKTFGKYIDFKKNALDALVKNYADLFKNGELQTDHLCFKDCPVDATKTEIESTMEKFYYYYQAFRKLVKFSLSKRVASLYKLIGRIFRKIERNNSSDSPLRLTVLLEKILIKRRTHATWYLSGDPRVLG